MEYSATVPKGYIISQSIKEGTKVPMGTKIVFTVSKGPEYVTIPDGIVGQLIDSAKPLLEDAGFTVKVIEKTNDGLHEEGEIAELTPKSGTSLVKGSEVYLQVWGAPPETEPETEDETETTTRFFNFGLF